MRDNKQSSQQKTLKCLINEYLRAKPTLSNEETAIVWKIRDYAYREHIIQIDCSDLKPNIENWWMRHSREIKSLDIVVDHKKYEELINALRSSIDSLKNLILKLHIPQSLLHQVDSYKHNISAVIITGLFDTKDKILALIVHEAMSELFSLKDIYDKDEAHKFIFNESNCNDSRESKEIKDWSMSSGEIRPHVDDCYYEDSYNFDASVDLLSLTTCHDDYHIPTLFYMAKHILALLSDKELLLLSQTMGLFVSGKNVSARKASIKPLLTFKENSVKIALDFRYNEGQEPRMQVHSIAQQNLMTKIAHSLQPENAVKSVSATGTFAIFANRKGCHARERLPISNNNSLGLYNSNRLLLRSKGPRQSPTANKQESCITASQIHEHRVNSAGIVSKL